MPVQVRPTAPYLPPPASFVPRGHFIPCPCRETPRPCKRPGVFAGAQDLPAIAQAFCLSGGEPHGQPALCQRDSCGGATGPGSGRWAANAASVTDVSVRSITMSLPTRSTRCPSWWTRSSRFPAGGSSATHRRGQRQKIGRTSSPRTGSATRRRATKPGKTARKRADSCGFRRFLTVTGEGWGGSPSPAHGDSRAVQRRFTHGKISRRCSGPWRP